MGHARPLRTASLAAIANMSDRVAHRTCRALDVLALLKPFTTTQKVHCDCTAIAHEQQQEESKTIAVQTCTLPESRS
jgi:hypothetical protein